MIDCVREVDNAGCGHKGKGFGIGYTWLVSGTITLVPSKPVSYYIRR